MICNTKLNNIEYGSGQRDRNLFQSFMASKKPRRTPMTEEQRRDCRLLREKWDELKRGGKPLSQKQLAVLHGVDPSAVSQILRCHIALNTEWKLNFAQYMDVLPQHIWSDWAYTRVTAGRIPPGMAKIVEAWDDMPDEKKLALTTLITS